MYFFVVQTIMQYVILSIYVLIFIVNIESQTKKTPESPSFFVIVRNVSFGEENKKNLIPGKAVFKQCCNCILNLGTNKIHYLNLSTFETTVKNVFCIYEIRFRKMTISHCPGQKRSLTTITNMQILSIELASCIGYTLKRIINYRLV